MSDESRSIRVSIFGRDYNIKGGSDEEYIRELAEHVNKVMYEIADKAGSLSSGRIAILAALNIADEMFKTRGRLNELADELAQRLEETVPSDQQQPSESDQNQQPVEPGQQPTDDK